MWTADICFEKAEPGEAQEFPLTQEGLDALLACLEQRHAAMTVWKIPGVSLMLKRGGFL